MQEYVDADMRFEGVEEETEKVVKMFRERGFEEKALLLETSGDLYSKYYRLNGSVDYFYGCLTPSTGYIWRYMIDWRFPIATPIPRPTP